MSRRWEYFLIKNSAPIRKRLPILFRVKEWFLLNFAEVEKKLNTFFEPEEDKKKCWYIRLLMELF